MSNRNWRHKLALGGLATAAVTAALLYGTWWFASPQEPRIPRHEASQTPKGDYHPGGAACDPKRLNALPPQQAPAERDRCAEAAEDHRAQPAELRQTTRANDLAEGDLRLAYQQARIAFAQTLATVLAFVAAAIAAVFAGVAVYHSKRSADADNLALRATRRAAREARGDAAEATLRFKEQMDKTQEMVEFTAKSSYAMEHSATATRRMAGSMSASAAATNRTAEAALRQAELTERAMTIMERPYVFFHTTKRLKSALGLAQLSPNSYQVVWKNFGKTPALVSRVRLGVSREDGGADPSTMPKHEMPFGAIIGVDDAWPRGQIVITDQMLKEFNDDARPIWLCGEITYSDLHGKDHRSWFCRFYVGMGFVLDDGCDPAFNGYE